MNGPSERDLRIQAIWERGAEKARANGFPPMQVAMTMFAAAVRQMQAQLGDAAMAQYLGHLAVAFQERAGGEIEELLAGETIPDNDDGPARH